MEWQDHGLILAVRPHGESAAIVSLLTTERGRHAGLVRGGQSRSRRGMLQPGNQVLAVWHARLADQLGTFTLEPVADLAAPTFDDTRALSALSSAMALLDAGLPERDPQPGLFAATLGLLHRLGADGAEGVVPDWATAYVAWELNLLSVLGFGVDLRSCAATGTTRDLVYVSPRSGRAVSAEAGAPWAEKMLGLPPFLRPDGVDAPVGPKDIASALRLTGFFLERYHLSTRGRGLPDVRLRLVEGFQK